MFLFFIIIFVATILIGWIAYNIKDAELQNSKSKRRKKTDSAFDINNLPPNMPSDQKEFLHKVAEFTGSNKVTQYNIQAFLADNTAKDFAKIPGWDKWTADKHLMVGQEERQKRALYSQTMRIINFDPTTGQALVHGESGQDYEVSGKGCSCKDFRVRKLPCKHMYFVSFNINDEKN